MLGISRQHKFWMSTDVIQGSSLQLTMRGRLSARWAAIWLGMTVALVVVDAFGVAAGLGLPGALSFWGGLVGINMLAWAAWRSWLPEEKPGARFVVGALALNGLLALEVPLLYRLMGRADATPDWRPFVYGLAVSIFIAYLLQASRTRRIRERADIDLASTQTIPAVTLPARILARAGIDNVADVLSVNAEDHYCRLVLRRGGSVLIHYRFKDAVDELGDQDGVQVHRGVWVASHAVTGGKRIGRRWSLGLVNGTSVAVSDTRVALCRARGWLKGGDELA